MPAPKQDRNKRFWSKVDKTSGCWVWTAGRFKPTLYGAFQDEGKAKRAHRVSWEMTNGEVPDGLDVLHKCDNPPCVKPDHLFLGTQADNNRDRDSKGRQASGGRHGSRLHPESRPKGKKHFSHTNPEKVARGEEQGSSRLTEEDVLAIRREYVPYKVSYPVLAKKYGVNPETVARVVRREHWVHLPEEEAAI